MSGAVLLPLALALLLQAPGAPAADASTLSAARSYFTDTELVDQDGRTLRFYSDLIRGRSVVINTFFTTCSGICPPLNRRMAQIQERVAGRLGRDVHLVSISVDPETDTPPRLKQYATQWGARPGWYFLTGPRERVELVLRKLGQFAAAPDDHSGVLLVGNDRTELWKKAFALARSEDVLSIVDSVVNDR